MYPYLYKSHTVTDTIRINYTKRWKTRS